MNSLLYYYNNVQKMAAYRQAKRMQCGVKLGENQVTTTATKFTTAPLQIGTGDFSVEFYGNSYGSDGNLGYSFIRYAGGSTLTNNAFNILSKAGTNGLSVVQFGNRTISLIGYVNTDENGLFHLVLTRSGVTLTIYIDGTKFNEFTMDTVSDFGTMHFLLANSRNVGFVRVWNMCLSADDVTEHYNNGDPMGYVVPRAKRDSLLAEYLPQNLMESRKGSEVEPKAESYEFNIGDEYYRAVVDQQKYPYDCIYRVDYIVDEWDYQPRTYGSVGFLGISGAEIISGNYQWFSASAAKVGELQSFFVKMPGSKTPAFYIYGGNDNEAATARHLKVTIKGITSVSIPISWLDSAKQLPLSDEYMEPLFQSIGGYDMAANGAPEILYNE